MQRTGGVNRYFAEIISRLPGTFRPVIYGCRPSAPHVPVHPALRHVGRPPLHILSDPLVTAWSRGFNLIHPTYYHLTPPLSASTLRSRLVVTVHDFVMVRYADLYARSGKLITAQDAVIRAADYLICVSHSTRNDLLERFPECEGRSTVIHLGTTVRPASPNAGRAVGAPYVLYVGSRVFYKNFELSLKAAAEWRRRGVDLSLVVAGPPATDTERELLHRLDLENCAKFVEFPNDAELAALYRGALVLLYPSCFEGFGLPPLEAMAHGCPVIALGTSSLPEVVGDGGILLDPLSASAETVADAVVELATNEIVRTGLSQRATAQAAKFDWDNTVRETVKVYDRVCA